MSLAEIVKALPTLKRDQRRELARRIFEVDQRADDRFQILDAMEDSDGQAGTR